MLFSKDTLLSYFFSKAVSDDAFRYNLWFDENAINEEEYSEVINHIKNVSRYLLLDNIADSQTIQSIIWLISEYSHNHLEVPERVDIKAHLNFSARTEPLLHSLKEFYRDHFFHVMEVCFTGHFLLELKINSKYLWEVIAKKLKIGNKEIVVKLWYITALLHDVGYGIDALKSLLDFLKFFKNAPSLEKLSVQISDLIDVISEELNNENKLEYGKIKSSAKDHGIISAHHLFALLCKISDDDPTVDLNEYKHVINAISLHNYRKNKISFNSEPLAFLLILCDTLQEWKRMQLNYSNSPLNIISSLLGNSIHKDDLLGPFKEMYIENIKYNQKDDSFQLEKGKPLIFKLIYDEKINKNTGVFSLWLDASCNLQRLDYSDFPFDIAIEYITPLFRKNGKELKQLHRLRNLKNELHLGFLHNWMPEINNNGILTNLSRAVEYKYDENICKERLTLNLRQLTLNKAITKDISEFYKRLPEWKHYHDDKEFVGDYAKITPD